MFLVLAALLVAGWEGRSRGAMLILAVGVSAMWAGFLAWQSTTGFDTRLADEEFVVDMVRNAAWVFFMAGLLYQDEVGRPARGPMLTVLAGLTLVLVVGLSAESVELRLGSASVVLMPRLIGLILASLVGIVLVEQIFRNARLDRRWAVKYFCLGLLGILGYDLYLYSEALLTGDLDREVWIARGMANAVAAPLIAVAAARNRDWSTRIFVSRHIVFYTTSLVGVGVFLVLMAIGAYYIKTLGGNWGSFAQIVFFFGSVVLLGAIALSAAFRARLRVFLAKHFYSNKYDYREEWLGFIACLSDMRQGSGPQERVIQAMSELMDSTGGLLWLVEGEAGMTCVAGFNMLCPEHDALESEQLEAFWRSREWIIDLAEYRSRPDAYPALTLPTWLNRMQNAWLLIPLPDQRGLLGFVLLDQSRAPRPLNWEDRDLLKTAAREAANYLALGLASDELARARQFEAFNRLSAYVVHDLKNLIAQLDLVVSNARHHQTNPDFMADAIETVGNSVAKMKRLLVQLRKGRFEYAATKLVDLCDVVDDVVEARALALPRPSFEHSSVSELWVRADREHLAATLGHLVQNGQEAAGSDGRVWIRLQGRGSDAVIEIEDTGPGMSREFIRERLFAPFETTKGNAGMGIGAYEARDFIRALGGSLSVESEVGGGTVFTVRLPRVESESPVATAL